ncbi:ribonucleoside-diphosphate reductase, adenosylcobalamin-dependent [Candidatus Beckwithbacteria bacterium RBG_13_42_9]|uniref:Vitamin B12-dependent ribonucleotide reductase n=1 Tax=Candidatus Beckwithbacteria bacterium RBG_13_42_9 TaxID=1797457 RepID=A0A1F5E8E1_9BACT|nr:MAG: ribonucleoside-diphosphate reductase, adenosylcobalamin-dependent [Candidatus Beckwithbacteria bacterium RBG_13_42_9]
MNFSNTVNLPKNALEVFVERYSLRDEHGKTVEMPKEIFARTARVVAESENRYRDGIKPEEIREKFYQMLYNLRFIPNGRTLANAGAGSGQLANCFVLPIDDDLGRTENSIFMALRNAVLILQSGGGVGFSFGRLRHKGAVVSTSKGKATGAVSFLKIYDTAFWVIGQGGGRRSACMGVLPIYHPDILDFVRCKETEGEIEHFNISVGITDEFMRAVKNDKNFALIDPHTQAVVRQVKARKIFNQIVHYAHHNGEPGVLFLDAINRGNPVANQYQLEATNPCGEQALGPFENCCMASINLREHVKERSQKLFDAQIDWLKLAETVTTVVRFLDDVIDANKYVPAVPQLQEAAFKNRRIGVSIMGLADMMYLLGVAYGSREGEDLASQVMEFIQFQAISASVQLAKERGAFPGIKDSRFDPENLQFKSHQPLVKSILRLGRPKLNWQKLGEQIRESGLRNASQTTIAPTGAIATISGLEGYGCEPVFSLSYVMRTHEGAQFAQGKDFKELYYESQLFAQALTKLGIKGKEQEKIFAQVRQSGSCQEIKELPEKLRKVFVVSSDLSASQHVRMQAALQRFVDNSISKTINFPAEAKEDEVKKAYFQAWQLGCKGMTVYVTGSRKKVVLEVGAKDDQQKYSVNGNGFRGKPLLKLAPGEAACPECGSEMVMGESCMTCLNCGYSRCDV